MNRKCIYFDKFNFKLNIAKSYTWAVWDSQRSPPHEPGIIDKFFLFIFSDSLGHLREIYLAAKI